MGEKFRGDSLLLSEEESIAATYLGLVLKRGVDLSDVFVGSGSKACALDKMENSWLDVLTAATSFTHKSATDRIWTCGLTDAGLHNAFLGEERGLELFDLGEPQFMPVPAFLTKFLMSFFHALGMEEDVHCCGRWVKRFMVHDGRLELTHATKDLLPSVYEAFDVTVDSFIQNIFEGDGAVRKLLATYVVLQLLSDAAFCLQRWEQKGGGQEKYGDRVGHCLNKWLWRSLWDLYIASEVHETVLSSCC